MLEVLLNCRVTTTNTNRILVILARLSDSRTYHFTRRPLLTLTIVKCGKGLSIIDRGKGSPSSETSTIIAS